MNRKKFRGWCTNGCGGEIKQGATKYCSLRCHINFEYKARVALLKRGEYPAYEGTGGATFIRRFLRVHYEDKCARCGWNEKNSITGRSPLEVEHIDGDWRNTRLDNLILLCPNCHALTPTFRALNRGRGRATRRGGRENPERGLGDSRQLALRPRILVGLVETKADLQLVLELNADVAERLKAPDL